MCSQHKQTWSTLYFCRKCDGSVCSELLREVAYVCELESLDRMSSVECEANYIVVKHGQKTLAV
jgi:hypothetical protein